MESNRINISKLIALTAFILVAFVAILYGFGVFDFTFADRDRYISGGPEETIITPPTMSEDDKKLEDELSHLGVGDNISNINTPDDEKDDEETKEPGETSEKDPEKDPSANEQYHPANELLLAGMKVSDAEWRGDDTVLLAELFFPEGLSMHQVQGKKLVIADAPKIYEEGGEYFFATDKKEVYRFVIEPYMGYIIMNLKGTTTVFTSRGEKIATCGYDEIIPAYIRDRADNPLFYDEDGKLFYFDASGERIPSDYDPETDDRGLYIDYEASFGKSDNELEIYSRYEDVYFLDELDTSDFYQLSWVDPDLAYSIYIMRPDYASKVARYNPRFAEALEAAKKKIEEEKRLEEEKKAEDALASESEPLETPPADETEIPILPDTSAVGTETSADETTSPETALPETSTPSETTPIAPSESEIPEDTDAPETGAETGAETGTNTETGTDTSDPTLATVPPETESAPDPNLLIIERTLNLRRFAYGRGDLSGEEIDLLTYNYAKAYNFSEMRAAVVDDDGVLRYINKDGKVVIDGTGTRLVTSSRYVATEYAEPLYRYSEFSRGYLYFDEGLVRVRKIERDYSYRNLIYSDSDVLLYPDGTEFYIPHGYTLTAYSEGVLVLKGADGRYGYYHKDGYWITQPVYTSIKPFSEGLGVIGFEGGKRGVIDEKGNIVVPFAYEYITAPSSGVIAVYSYEGGWRILLKLSR